MPLTVVGQLLAVIAAMLLWLPPTAPRAYYVDSTNGDDANPGSLNAPLKSLAAARSRIASYISSRPNQQLDVNIVVYLRQGEYHEPSWGLPFTLSGPLNSGNASRSITFTTYPGEHAILHGGQRVTGWTMTGVQPDWLQPGTTLWQAPLSANAAAAQFRELYLNNTRMIRARTPNLDAAEPIARIIGGGMYCSTYCPGPERIGRYFTIDQHVDGLSLCGDGLTEMVAYHTFSFARQIVQSAGSYPTVTTLYFQDQCAQLGTQVSSYTDLIPGGTMIPAGANCPCPTCYGQAPPPTGCSAMPWTTNSPAYPGDHGFLENNFRFLDAHAEWFADFPNATLYAVLSNTIVPNPNDPAVTIIAPVASRLVEATNVQNVVFDHLNFGFANFPLPPTGYRSQNAGLAWRYDLTCPGVTSELGDGNLIIRGAIRFRSSNNCTVSYCRIAHMGATGVEMFGDNDTVRGNEIFDLGGSGIIIADGLGFTPTCGAQVIDNKVTQFGRAYWDAFGIWAPSCRDALLQGNEVAIGRGTGLSVGSQRGQTGAGHACTCAGNAGFIGHDSILRNKVHHVGLRMGDVAGIYAIDEQSGRCWGNPGDPLSVMHDNFVYCITRDPLLCTAGAVGGIGFDNFSAGWDVGNNVIETDEIPMSFSTFQTVDPDPAAGLWAWGNCGSGTAPNYVDQDLSFLTLMHPPLTQAAYNAVAASFCTYSHVADRCSGGPDPIRPAGAAAIVAAAGPSPNMNYPFQLPPDPQIDP